MGEGSVRLEHAAGDPPTAIAAGIGLQIVGGRMDDDRRAIGVEEPRNGRPRQHDAQRTASVIADGHVGHVALVRPLRIEAAMLALRGVPVTAGGGEVGRVAAADGMDMNAVHARGHVHRVERDAKAARHLGRGGTAGIGARAGAQRRGRARRAGQGSAGFHLGLVAGGKAQCDGAEGQQRGVFHIGSSLLVIFSVMRHGRLVHQPHRFLAANASRVHRMRPPAPNGFGKG